MWAARGSSWLPLLIFTVAFNGLFVAASRNRRSIELSSAQKLITDNRLPTDIEPSSYILQLHPDVEASTFTGIVKINLTWRAEAKVIELHSHYELQIDEANVRVRLLSENGASQPEKEPKYLDIKRTDRLPKRPIFQVHLKEPLKNGSKCELEIPFNGQIWEQTEGLFKAAYTNENGVKVTYLATQNRPNYARKIFPCFDEPAFKVPFTVSISRPSNYSTLFNSKLQSTKPMENKTNYVLDHFETTVPLSTFAFGFIISQLTRVNSTASTLLKPKINVWARKDLHNDLTDIYEKVTTTLKSIQNYWNIDFPLDELNLVAAPGLSSVNPIDNSGLILFKESDLTNKGYYNFGQELIYQWLGIKVAPYWWTDAHVNKAIVGFLAASTVHEIDNGREFDGKWPMTALYSIYYEFSKRYPHSRITAMKQETTCYKTQLVLRMLNYTLGPETFKKGLQKLFKKDECKEIFFTEDVWKFLTQQAHQDNTLPADVTVNEIATSWITKDRLPVVNVERDYSAKTAVVSQRVYLRERPHDVPEQDKMLWWIPLVLVRQDKLQFNSFKPDTWIKKTRDIILTDLPAEDKFIIVNPEEIGPFPVNYDTRNWNLLAEFLQTAEGRKQIPTYTRAKLLHDAWNLAYAGDLSFATAFNMTLFMKFERDHVVWNPVSTFIDHIGRHIDMSSVHKKFEIYVRMLLTPLYEELGPVVQENEEKWVNDLRSIAKTFLCRAGYRPCIEEAQAAYHKWMDSDNPNEGNPVPNQYICPVFKWGTMQEWEFGLQRVINFPSSRKQSERTYLLKTLAGCPIQAERVERLLNITILEQNGNFTENDLFLIFSMLTGGSNGYATLFNFVQQHWDTIKKNFKDNTNLWDSLISAATGVFTTQEGYDMVSNLYAKHHGDFGSAEHIIKKSLKNIKEEAKWSDANLPVIEKWLDDYLKTVDVKDDKFL